MQIHSVKALQHLGGRRMIQNAVLDQLVEGPLQAVDSFGGEALIKRLRRHRRALGGGRLGIIVEGGMRFGHGGQHDGLNKQSLSQRRLALAEVGFVDCLLGHIGQKGLNLLGHFWYRKCHGDSPFSADLWI